MSGWLDLQDRDRISSQRLAGGATNGLGRIGAANWAEVFSKATETGDDAYY